MIGTAKKMEKCRLFCGPAIAGRGPTPPTFGPHSSLTLPFRKWPSPPGFGRRSPSSRRKMPLPAEGAEVGFALPFDPQEAGGVQGVALAAIPPFPTAAVLSLVRRGLLHGFCVSSQTSPHPLLGKRQQTQGAAPAFLPGRRGEDLKPGVRRKPEAKSGVCDPRPS